MPRPRLGAHVSIAGGLHRVPGRARDLGAEVVQVFPQSPRQWRGPEVDDGAVVGFGRALATAGIPLYLHAIYLVNPASPDPGVRERSAEALGRTLAFGGRAGARGVVCHLGAGRGTALGEAVARAAETVGRALDAALSEWGGPLPRLLLETGAGTRGSLGADPNELEALLAGVPGDPGVCLDSAHLFAAGHPVHTPDGLDRYLTELDRRFGLDRVGFVHLNDSKVPLGAGADRHENLGEGRIGLAGLGAWVRCPSLAGVDFAIETPGFDGRGPDRENLGRAKALRAGITQPTGTPP